MSGEFEKTYFENSREGLVHRRYRDDFGILRDHFEVYKIADNGHKTIYPFLAPPKVNNFTRDTNIGDATSEYDTKDYADMLQTELQKITKTPIGVEK